MEMDFGLGCQVFHFPTKSDSSQNRRKRPDCRRSTQSLGVGEILHPKLDLSQHNVCHIANPVTSVRQFFFKIITLEMFFLFLLSLNHVKMNISKLQRVQSCQLSKYMTAGGHLALSCCGVNTGNFTTASMG